MSGLEGITNVPSGPDIPDSEYCYICGKRITRYPPFVIEDHIVCKKCAREYTKGKLNLPAKQKKKKKWGLF